MQHNDTYILLANMRQSHDKLYVGLHKNLKSKNLTLQLKEDKKGTN